MPRKPVSEPPGDGADRLMTPAEAAALLGLDPKAIVRWADRGLIAAVRTLGGHRRYLAAELEAPAKATPARATVTATAEDLLRFLLIVAGWPRSKSLSARRRRTTRIERFADWPSALSCRYPVVSTRFGSGTIDRMGAWGTAIFSDDTASDVRSEYREMLEDQVPDVEATQRVIEAYQHLDIDEQHVLWLALAAAQFQVGRLENDIKARALEVIDGDVGLGLWEEAGPKELAQRRAALSKLREQITGSQPARKTLRRPWHHETDLQPGDVLSFTAASGQLALLRVLRVDSQRLGAAPIVERLEWRDRTVPAEHHLVELGAMAGPIPGLGGPRRPATYRVSRFRKKDQDWSDSGFVIAARLPTREADVNATGWTYLQWRGLAANLERDLAQ
jgi:excisionase family DNA binding protein